MTCHKSVRRRILVAGRTKQLTKRELIRAMVENGIGHYEGFRFVKSDLPDSGKIRPGRGKGKKRKPWEKKFP